MSKFSKKAFSCGIIYLLSSVIKQMINLFLIPIYTRNITQSQFGQYSLLNSFLELFSIVITLGIISGMVRFFYDFKDKEESKNTAITFLLLCGGVYILFVYLIIPHISYYFLNNDYNANKYIYLMYIISILTCIIATYENFYTMKFNGVKSSIISIAVMILNFIFALFLVAKLQRGIIGILECLLYSKLIVCIILLGIDLKNKRLKFKIHVEKFKMMIKYGIGTVLGQISSWILTLIDRYFIKEMINLSVVGLYSMGYRIGMLINPIFIVPFINVFNPYKFSVYKSKDGKLKIKNLFNYYNFIGWFCILGLALYAKFIIIILSTGEYIDAFKMVPLITFSYYLWGMGSFYGFGLVVAKKSMLSSGITVLAAIINIIANIILIPLIGMYGAAYSTIISYMIVNIFYYFIGKKYYDLELNFFSSYKFGIIFTVIYILYLGLTQHINKIWIEFLLNIVLCSLYVLLSILFRFISKDIFIKGANMIKDKIKLSPKK